MYKFLPVFISGLAFVTAFCTTDPQITGPSSNPPAGDTTVAPVETKAANTNYKPAFPGQTRIGGVKTTTPYSVTQLTADLKRPWGMVQLPDGRFIVTEKGGSMRIVSNTGSVGAELGGVPSVNSGGQGGLLGITIDPEFASNRMVYWTFSENTADGNLTAVAKGKLSADDKSIENATVIFRAYPAYKGTNHYGSRIVFDRTGHLFVSTGERSDLQTRVQSQDPKSGLGKVMRITKDGKPAEGNPYTDKSQGMPEVYTYGHRNVQSLAIHPETGELWEAEFGPRGGDELNRIQKGKNYGWPVITYGIEYGGPQIGEGLTQKEGMEQPVYYWDPVLSPGGMTFYSGDQIPEWKNNLFIGGLSSQHIARLVIKDNKVVGEERLLADQNQRFRDVIQGNDGALYALTDGGRMYKIAKK